MKTQKIIYYVVTGLFTALMLFSVSMYFLKYADMVQGFTKFGYPTYIIYPLAVAKILGLIAIWLIKNKTLKEWAYAGFFFNIILAFFAHYMIGDGEQGGAIIAFVLLALSYYFGKKITNN
ncbi:DoxX family protein [Kordia jejudonensis]|uniref:DoxX family protein n=1 Tax=Kordia jejudonensis TaxID=1348245 RepID=UPI00062947CD|nr:DoxX family protein [Kordia jejudonensis]